jgi:hypothetical protein
MPSAVPAAKAYLVGTLLPSLFSSPILIAYGYPSVDVPQDIIVVGNARTAASMPVMGTTRPYEEAIELDILFSSSRKGGQDQQQVATEAAFALFNTFRDYFKTNPNQTLGGAVRQARVVSYQLTEDGPDDEVMDSRLAQIASVLLINTRN